jgi:hypothetical protein
MVIEGAAALPLGGEVHAAQVGECGRGDKQIGPGSATPDLHGWPAKGNCAAKRDVQS